MSEAIEIRVPDIGDYKNVPVIEVLVKVGDAVKSEDPLLTLESDKATMEVPAPRSGTVREVKVKVGDKVSAGSSVLLLDAVVEALEPAATPTPARGTAPPSPPSVAPIFAFSTPSTATASNLAVHASPSVRRFARELGADLSKILGSGFKRRILKQDVQAFIKGELTRGQTGTHAVPFNLPPLSQIDFAKFGPIKLQPLTRIKKLSGGHLHRNWLSIPHVTQHDEADITELERFRKQRAEELKGSGIRFTPLVFVLKASVLSLKHYPQFNASLAGDGENLVLKEYFNIGVAVDTPQGLVVPVIRDVDKKTPIDLARELGEISSHMRDGKIHPTDLQGGCFSISSLGGIGGTTFTPIINAPEVAILGVSKAQMKPVWDGYQFVPRLLMPLSLSYDHRVIDGAQGARFLSYLSGLLADVRQLGVLDS